MRDSSASPLKPEMPIRSVRGGLYGGEVLVGPAPEFYKIEAVGLGGVKPL